MSDDDPYSRDFDALAFMLRQNFAMQAAMLDPISVIALDVKGLPEPLRGAARQMRDRTLSRDERRAAGEEFLALSQEWIA